MRMLFSFSFSIAVVTSDLTARILVFSSSSHENRNCLYLMRVLLVASRKSNGKKTADWVSNSLAIEGIANLLKNTLPSSESIE